MAPLCASLAALASVAALLFGQTIAQDSSDNGSSGREQVWAAVAFVMHGERTPLIGSLNTVLTPEGAQQLFRQGEAFRSRYLSGEQKELEDGDAPINNLDADSVDNTEVNAFSSADEWIVGGATAFFQGLYPATDFLNGQAGGSMLGKNLLEKDGNGIQYPLNGYQYAQIQTFSEHDSQSPDLEGSDRCPAWTLEMNTNIVETQEMTNSLRHSDDFYKRLFDEGVFAGTVPMSQANYWNSYELYDFVKYMYAHNETANEGFKDTANETLSTLESYALQVETAYNTAPYESPSDETNRLYTIAGRTLAARIEKQFGAAIGSAAAKQKLTVMFGSHRPLMSFFDIAGLRQADGNGTGPFDALPENGAAMVFELVGGSDDSISIPKQDDLSVRFVYRKNADKDSKFETAPLFGSESGSTMPWSAFSREMTRLAVQTGEWCSLCNAADALWCSAGDRLILGGSGGGSSSSSSSDGGKKSGIAPAVAGVIGAVVAVVLTGLIALALFFVGGFRLRRGENAGDGGGDAAGGGFKGAGRMPDDKDVAINKAGTQHTRVGSWELRDDGGTPPFGGAGILTRDFGRHESMRNAEDDGISVTGSRVVTARESI